MEFRESQVVEVRADKREIVGIAVPYDQIAEIRTAAGSYKEKFLKGAIEDNIEAPVYFRHDHQSNGLSVGSILSAISTDQGLEVTTKIYRSAKGNQVLEDALSGKLKNFSIGFNPLEHEEIDGITVRTKVSLEEVSLVESPAYAGAAVIEIRESNNKKEDDEQIMSIDNDNLSTEVDGLRESVTDLERKLETVLEVRESTTVAGSASLADAVIAAYNGKDAEADRMHVRAYTGSSSADNVNRPIWVDKELGFIEKRRPLSAVFGSEPIPGDSGMTIEYSKVGVRTGSVAKQTAEGEPLTFNKVTIVDASAPIETFGGYTELSVQALKFGKAPLLQTTLKHLGVEYAKATETKVSSTLTTATGFNAVTRGAVTGVNAASAWIGAVEDSLVAIEDNSRGLAGSHIVVSRDVHKALLTTTDTTGRPLFVVNGDGQNTYGSVTPGAAGQAAIAGLPVISGPNLAANSFYVVSNEAILVWESSIFELSDENIVNLTELRSLYGYLATGVFDAKGISKVTWS